MAPTRFTSTRPVPSRARRLECQQAVMSREMAMPFCWGFHQWTDWSRTYTEPNMPCEATRTCKRCGYSRTEARHDWVPDFSGSRISHCSRCKTSSYGSEGGPDH
jgi:hypothetical protein